MALIVVVGMHRSGTSITANLLTTLGAESGKTKSLTPGDVWNPTGYLELSEVRELNDELLRSVGCNWHRIARFDNARIPLARSRKVSYRLEQIIAEEFTAENCLLKDPRFCFTLPAFDKVLSECRYTLVFRNPLAVARSLQVRNSFPLTLGLALWEAYNRTLLSNLQGSGHTAVFYEELVADPEPVIERIIKEQSITSSESKKTEAAKLVQAEFDHSLDTTNLLQEFPAINELWLTLRSIDCQTEFPIPTVMSAISRDVLELHEQRCEQKAKAWHQEKELEALKKWRESVDTEISNAKQEIMSSVAKLITDS